MLCLSVKIVVVVAVVAVVVAAAAVAVNKKKLERFPGSALLLLVLPFQKFLEIFFYCFVVVNTLLKFLTNAKMLSSDINWW